MRTSTRMSPVPEPRARRAARINAVSSCSSRACISLWTSGSGVSAGSVVAIDQTLRHARSSSGELVSPTMVSGGSAVSVSKTSVVCSDKRSGSLAMTSAPCQGSGRITVLSRWDSKKPDV